ncbi:MAG: hypothetical protein E1N59_2358 [Puniceicoccaceae bacterium 5H]|nr:MAG: hypothetical protein E1N59_2358 [Puniceicoccaceae bacterium 5H]
MNALHQPPFPAFRRRPPLHFAKWAALALCFLLTACDRFPKDPEGSLEKAQERGTLRVGLFENPPWVIPHEGQAPGGLEPQLVQGFADELGLQVAWHEQGAEDAFDALEHHQLDLVIGGMTQKNPWAKHVGTTLPYLKTRSIIATPTGEAPAQNAPVAVKKDSVLAALLESQSYTPQPMDDLAQAEGAVAAPQWQAAALGLQETGVVLQQKKHVMAVPRGENALLMHLESYLLEAGKQHSLETQLKETAR